MAARSFGLHTQTAAVLARSDRAARVAAFVCAALEPRAAASDAPIEVSALEDQAEAAEELMRVLAQRLVWDYADGLALHAAAVASGDAAILFPASSGGGKSTLAVHLAALPSQRFRFLTDELVLVPHGTAVGCALARPAHLKPGSLFLIERHAPLRHAAATLRYAQGALIAAAALGCDAPPAPLPIGAIVFPSWSPGAAAALERLPAGRGAHALTGALVNARNLPQLGVPECARLAAQTPCYRLQYGELDDVEALLVRTSTP